MSKEYIADMKRDCVEDSYSSASDSEETPAESRLRILSQLQDAYALHTAMQEEQRMERERRALLEAWVMGEEKKREREEQNLHLRVSRLEALMGEVLRALKITVHEHKET